MFSLEDILFLPKAEKVTGSKSSVRPAILSQVEDIAPGVGRTDLWRTQIIRAQPSPLTQSGWKPRSLLICFDCMGHSWIPKRKMAAGGGTSIH